MADGFGLAGAGRGFSRSFGNMSNFFNQLSARNIQQEQLAEQKKDREFKRDQLMAKQSLEQLNFMRDRALADLGEMKQGYLEVAAQDPAKADKMLQGFMTPLESAGGLNMIQLRVRAAQQAGMQITEEQILQDLNAARAGVMTAAQEAERDRQLAIQGAQQTATDLGVPVAQAAQGAGLIAAPQRPQQPTTASMMQPFIDKLARGERLTPGETAAFNALRSSGGINIQLRYDDQGRPIAVDTLGAGTVAGAPVAGGASVEAGPGGTVTATEQVGLGPSLKAGKQFDQGQRLGLLENTINRLDEQIANIADDPQDYGIVGDLRGTAQEFVGLAEDLAAMTGQNRVGELLQDMAGAVGEGLYDTDLPAIQQAENTLAVRLALLRANRPGNESRALKSFLDVAREETKLTGLTTGRAVAERLQGIKRIFEEERQMLIRGLSGREAAPMQGGSTGGGPKGEAPAGAPTATNPETGERVYQDPSGAWVPY